METPHDGRILGGARTRRASMFDPIDPTEIQKTLYSKTKVSYGYQALFPVIY
jgi:hypothetical protein